eukprot:1336072-Pleurochrysis_carterae.AAC.1
MPAHACVCADACLCVRVCVRADQVLGDWMRVASTQSDEGVTISTANSAEHWGWCAEGKGYRNTSFAMPLASPVVVAIWLGAATTWKSC